MIEEAAPPSAGQVIRAQWRRWRAPALLVTFILAAGLVIALLESRPPVVGPLDPNDTGPAGAHAVVALLSQRGQTVARVETPSAALAASRQPGTTLVVTSPYQLSSRSLATLAFSNANLLLVAPDPAALSSLAPEVSLAPVVPEISRPPMCGLAAARLAGAATMGGETMRTAAPGAWRCYPSGSLPLTADFPARVRRARALPENVPATPPGPPAASLIRYVTGGRTITVLGAGALLSNQYLGRDGNAALAMNLLNGGDRVVWLVPGPSAAGTGGPRSGRGLIPRAVYLVALELAVTVVLVAGWRARRFGPLVAEPLPVVVRASETVRGHGRLYRARRARGRAAAVLRAAALDRITRRLGLPGADMSPAEISQELATRTGREPAQIQAILFTAVPSDDSALVKLAADLDTLEGQVLAK